MRSPRPSTFFVIGFGLFTGGGEAGRWVLGVVALSIVAMLFAWMAHAERTWIGAALGLVARRALSNVADRLRHGA